MNIRTKNALLILGIIALTALSGFLSWMILKTAFFGKTASNIPIATLSTTPETILSNLDTPWGIAHLPSGDLLITQRSGILAIVGKAGKYIAVENTVETSEGGLLGVAVDPDHGQNKFIYVYVTLNKDGRLVNQVQRYTLNNSSISDRKVIIDDIPASDNHDGGALAFGPDGMLYATTGDAGIEENAQNTTSLSGKILRFHKDGAVPSDNPFQNYVWSYGHRNPQGIAWDDNNVLWSTEHGPSGAATGRDELNRIEKGKNYGWPVITGEEKRDGYVSPVVQSGDTDTWAPVSLIHAEGSLYFTGLRGQSLYKVRTNDEGTATLSKYFDGTYGRLRALSYSEGAVYMSTSNRDGRGSPKSNDDQILKFAAP